MFHASALLALLLSVAQLWYLWLILAIAAWTVLTALNAILAERPKYNLSVCIHLMTVFRPLFVRNVYTALRTVAYVATALLVVSFLFVGYSAWHQIAAGMSTTLSVFSPF